MNKIQKFNIVSGNGGDELYSDYGNCGRQLDPKSLFGGLFPRDLNLIWPWHNYMGRLSLPVSRLDCIAGYYGIQHKDPLLDKNVVQAWLNTTPELKNARYKNWMFEYLTEHNYPIEENFKNGIKI
jgi:asparagine synthetase B (glutamine-hydrolysing)